MLSGQGGLTAPDSTAPARAPVPRLFDLVAAGALYGALLFLAFTLADPDLIARGESEAGVFLGLQTLDDGILAAVALAFGRLRFPGSLATLGVKPVALRWWAIGLGGGGVAAVLAWALSAVLEYWGWPAPPAPVESVLVAARGVGDILLVLFAVTVPVPLAEELFFRGFAYRLVRARLGVAVAVATSSSVFAVVHGLEVGAWLPVLPVGLVFAVLVELSGSLWPAVLGHAVVNALAVLVA